MSSSLSLSVVIPAYNERERLGATLDRVLDYLSTVGAAGRTLAHRLRQQNLIGGAVHATDD